MDKSSNEYKKLYYEIERYLMDNCEPLKEKVAASDKLGQESFSKNEKALAGTTVQLTFSSLQRY